MIRTSRSILYVHGYSIQRIHMVGVEQTVAVTGRQFGKWTYYTAT